MILQSFMHLTTPYHGLHLNTMPRSPSQHHTSGVKVGARVLVSGGRTGVVRYLGQPQFAPGDWVGIELDTPSW